MDRIYCFTASFNASIIRVIIVLAVVVIVVVACSVILVGFGVHTVTTTGAHYSSTSSFRKRASLRFF